MSPTELDHLPASALPSYNARTEVGDIIVTKPDGWPWGKEERLPTFIVVKVAAISYEAAKKYEDALYSGDLILRVRKYRVPPALVQTAITQGQSIVTLTGIVFSSGLITKVS